MMHDSLRSKWFVSSDRDLPTKLRLFCLPFAGGNALAYRTWSAQLPSTIEVCSIQLPGRGSRLRETAFTDLSDLVTVLMQVLKPDLNRPFAIFGHSLGAIIGFELTRCLRRAGLPQPRLLAISGHAAPQLPDKNIQLHQLPNRQLIEMLRHYGGTPEEVLASQELLELFLPVIRADFTVLETYQYQPEPPLDCPISVFGGLEDPRVPVPTLKAWREQTRTNFEVHLFSGGHFFLQHQQLALLTALVSDLTSYIE